jgi:hypothetical protein
VTPVILKMHPMTHFVGSVNVDTTETQTNPVICGEERNSTTKKNESNEFTIFTVGSESEIESEWTVDMDTNGSNVRYKLDTGAQVNVLPKSQYNRLLRKPKLKNTKVKLTAYNGTNIPVVGKCIVRVAHKRIVMYLFCLLSQKRLHHQYWAFLHVRT